jgi:ElaB/YqjD/DUF883 family membrane-anchored ribosome-binding protein
MERDGTHLKEKAVAARQAVAELASEAKHYAADRFAAAKTTTAEKLKASNESVVGYVQKNPYKSIGIALGVGILAGMLLKRR